MAKEFYQRLQKYYSDIGKVLKNQANSSTIFPNTTDNGMSRERIYAEILKMHLPSSCNVNYGGFLFSLSGEESKQIDLIITNDKSLQYNFHNNDGSGKSFSCIDGCIGVASIKANLSSAELVDSLINIASLPNKCSIESIINPSIKIHNYFDWPYKIVYASNGVSIETALKTLTDYYIENSSIPFEKRPNIIHVAGNYIIIRVGKNGGKTRDGSIIEPNTFYAQTHYPDEYGIIYVLIELQKISMCSNHILFHYDEIVDNLPLD